jgi:hypothetical protein
MDVKGGKNNKYKNITEIPDDPLYFIKEKNTNVKSSPRKITARRLIGDESINVTHSIDQPFDKTESQNESTKILPNPSQQVQKISLPMMNNMKMEFIYNNTEFNLSKYNRQNTSNVEDYFQ